MTNRKNRYFDREDQFRSIVLSSDIDNESIEEVVQFILDANEYDDEQESVTKDYERKPIKLVINSFGGVIYDGFTLIGVIENSTTPIHTYCYGYAMSMGLPIFASGHKRFASKYATFMYHEALNNYLQYDKLSVIKDDLDECNRIMKQYDLILLLKSTVSQKQLDEVKKSRRDWYFTAEQALIYGVTDEII
jgi:ATP-dependent Clp protease protease subunit